MSGMSDPLLADLPCRRRRGARVVLVVLVAISAIGLLPEVSQAHFAAPGLGGAELDLGANDGDTSPLGAQKTVTGRNFVANDVARILMCPYAATDLLLQCQPIGAAQTDSEGGFSVRLPMQSALVTPSGPVQCAGFAGPTLCAVFAATFSPLQEPTAMAKHFICFQGGVAPCNPPDDGSTTTTTTTTTLPPGPEWEPATAMSTPREGPATAAGADGRIYVLGGEGADDEGLTSGEVFDTCAKTWTSLPPAPSARTHFAITTGHDGRIYVIGGRNPATGASVGTVEAYDPVSNSWSSLASLALPRSELAAATGADGHIYAIGGTAPGLSSSVNFDSLAVPTVEVYDPGAQQWQFTTPMKWPRMGHEAIRGPDGRIYVLGSTPNANGNDASLDYYTPGPAGTPGTWRDSQAQFNLPYALAAAGGPDGRIYSIGGFVGDQGGPRVVNVYNPTTDTWRNSTEPLTTARAAAGAALGRDGRIYAIGGIDMDSPEVPLPPLASTEALEVGPDNCPPGPPPPADFDGDNDTDVSVFRPESGTWFAKDGATVAYGAEGDIPVPADYDGDRVTDVAIFRPSVGLWAIHRSSDDSDVFVTYGIGTDIPVPADYDGDAKTDIAIYRPEFGLWWVRHSSTGADVPTTFGIATDTPVPADYDGDRRADLGIFRDGTWFTLPASGGNFTALAHGATGDVPVPGDYDADGVSDPAVFRPSDGTWHLQRSSDDTTEVVGFGISGDVPVPGDYNGDGISDPAVYRGGQWFTEPGIEATWGLATDIPLPLPAAIRLEYFP